MAWKYGNSATKASNFFYPQKRNLRHKQMQRRWRHNYGRVNVYNKATGSWSAFLMEICDSNEKQQRNDNDQEL